MRRSPLAGAIVGLAVVGMALAGCATGTASAGVASTPAATSIEPSATPTVEPIVIGPAEMPPVAFGGDCAKALTPGDIAAVIGIDMAPAASYASPVLINLGGISCTWRGSGGSWLNAAVIPRTDIGNAVYPTEYTAMYFEDCSGSWVCSWQGDGDASWMAVSFQGMPSTMTRQSVDAWGEALGSRITANLLAEQGDPWTRDRDGWLRVLDCADVARTVGVQLGEPLEGRESGWEDPPLPEYIMAIEASQQTDCWLGTDSEESVSVRIAPGLGGGPFEYADSAVEVGVPGITGYAGHIDEYGANYILTDGVNQIDVWAYSPAMSAETGLRYAVAVAAAAASDFQP